MCEPASVVLHEGGTTTGGLGGDLRRLQDRNRLWIAVRFGSRADIMRAYSLSLRRLRHPPRPAHCMALLQGMFAAPRLLVERRRAR